MNDTLLMVGDSARDADLLYAVGMSSRDPLIYLRLDGKAHLVIGDQELNRARARARRCRVHSLNTYLQRLKRDGHKRPAVEDVIALLLKENKIRKVAVPLKFPVGVAQELKKHGFKVKPRKQPVFPDREIKSGDEVRKISAALTIAEVALSEAIQVLRNSKVTRNGLIIYRGSPLTSERLRSVIDSTVYQAGGTPTQTVAVGSARSCDPHDAGHGRLSANHPIILEVAPRSQKTGYHGRITRTVVKGRSSEAARALYHAVATAQELIFLRLSDGERASEAHKAVAALFKEMGFQNSRKNGRLQGLVHHSGHGIGLDLEEAPYISGNAKDLLHSGQVVSVRPGLYFDGVGGVRLEDLAHVTRSRPQNLTKFEKILEV